MKFYKIVIKSDLKEPKKIYINLDHLLWLKCFDLIHSDPTAKQPYCIEIKFTTDIKPLICYFLTEGLRDACFDELLRYLREKQLL